ncbi:hypothetical protein J3R83DRAFT_5032 [Lanmaoa asiatica]|nr:hypothetical protein J3R83DRAFT_5032 [Lanmaoa asiatica]
MRRPRDVVLRASLYVAVALSGFAAAYVLKEALNTVQWLPHLWDVRVPPDDKPSSPQQDSSADEHPAPVTDTPPDNDAPTPSTNQARTLPPLRTHSLPPPLPNGHALLSRSSFAINADTSPFASSFHTSSDQDDVEEEGASQANTSDTDSFVDVLSPAPTQIVSRRHSVRAHDLFAASHISFSELGSLVAPQNEPE